MPENKTTSTATDPSRPDTHPPYSDHPDHSQRARASQSNGDGRPTVTGLIKQLRDETIVLLRQEIELAKTELSEKLARVARNGAFVIAGAVIAHVGVVLLVAALAYGVAALLALAGISEAVYIWLAPTIVGLIVVAIGGGLALKGYSAIRKESAMPERTRDTLQEDMQWLSNRTKHHRHQ